MEKEGVIYLVGTGPGDPELLTIKGLALLAEADAIVGDTIAQAGLLRGLEAEIHDVGSRRRGNKRPQAEVTALLLELAAEGQTVVRLWPGDPFVFGRAVEEMTAALEAGIRVEFVPGVSSALAVPAYAGVAVTDWDYGGDFAVVTGLEPDYLQQKPDWEALARINTLVILMPLLDLAEIVAKLMAAGRDPETPALVIQNGTLPQHRQVSATLSTLVEAVEAHQIEKQAIVVIGQAVRRAETLSWFQVGDAYPLRGQRALVTRPAHQAGEFVAALRTLGATPVLFPTIEIKPVADLRPLDDAIQRIAESAFRPDGATARRIVSLPHPYYDWVVLTSVNGVAAFWDRLRGLGLDSRCLAPVRLAAIGPATAAALQARGVFPDLIPEVYTAEGILAAFDQQETIIGQRFLLARSDIARPALAEGLSARGARVDEIPAYRTVPVEGERLPPPADIVTFTSSSTVRGYVNCLAGRDPAELLQDSRVVCIGPITAATAEELGLPISAVAEEHTIEGMLDLLKTLEV